MGVVQMSKGNLRPVSDDLLSEPAIVCRMARAVFKNKSATTLTNNDMKTPVSLGEGVGVIPRWNEYE